MGLLPTEVSHDRHPSTQENGAGGLGPDPQGVLLQRVDGQRGSDRSGPEGRERVPGYSGMTIWLERLRPSDLHIMLPQVLLTLDQIRDQAMAPERRLAMLRALRDQVEAIQSSIPVSEPSPPTVRDLSPPSVRPLTLDQRLARSWCSNLQRLLMDLGQPRYEGNARFAVYREWTLRQLLRGQRQAIEYGVRTGQPAAPGLWRSIYDLLLYLEGRDELQGPSLPGRYRFNPGTELKRLFLLGGIAALASSALDLQEAEDYLRVWAEGSELRRGEPQLSEGRALRLDLTRDGPPQWGSGEAVTTNTGWLLELPPSLTDHLESMAIGVRHQTEGA